MSPLTHLEDEIGNGGRFAGAPIAGRVDHQPFRPVSLDHIGSSRGRAFGDRIKGHARPKAFIENGLDRVFFDVVDEDARSVDAAIGTEHIEDHARSLVFVLEVRRMDQDRLVVGDGEVDMLEEDGGFVPGVLVESDFSDTQDVRPVEELGDHGDDFA